MPGGKATNAFAAQIAPLSGQVVLFVRIGAQIEQHLVRKQVEAVVISPHVKPAVPTDRTLTDMRALADDEFLAPARRAGSNCGGEGGPVPDVRRRAPEQLDQCRRQIELVMKPGIPRPADAARKFDDQRNMAGPFVGGGMLC